MADTKLNDLSSGAPAAATDIIYAVKDPGGTPADAKLTLGEVKTLVNTPSGSDTQVQFNDGGAFGGDSGLTFNKTSKALTLGGATITTSSPVIDAAQTWNASGTTFTGLKLNVTDTASASASLLMDLQVGGASRFSVGKTGISTTSNYLVSGSTGSANNPFSNGWWMVKYPSSNHGLAMSQGGAGTTLFSGTSTAVLYNSNEFSVISLGFSTSPTASFGDLFLTRRGAANLRLGAADAASPVAQTLSVQSVVAGTSNTAGTNLTITGSQGTGTGAGGSIIFQVAPAGSTGTAQNSLVSFVEVTSARVFNLYNTTDVATNFERGFARWSSNVFQIGTEKGGTGSGRTFDIVCNGLRRLVIGSNGINYLLTGNGADGVSIDAQSDGVLRLANMNVGGFGRLQFGGTTSSFPALKRSSTTLQVRLADDSANAPVESASVKTDAPAGGTSGTWKLGVAATVSPTSPNRTIEVDIGGTIYYIAAKTTND